MWVLFYFDGLVVIANSGDERVVKSHACVLVSCHTECRQASPPGCLPCESNLPKKPVFDWFFRVCLQAGGKVGMCIATRSIRIRALLRPCDAL